jgi:WD40 repeat protein
LKKSQFYQLRFFIQNFNFQNYFSQAQIVLLGSSEGTICIVDLAQRIATRMIEDHCGACITSLDSFYDDARVATCWLACSQDRKISVWSCKWAEDTLQMVDWITFPDTTAPSSSSFKSGKTQQTTTVTPSLARFEHSADGKPAESIVYVGHGSHKQLTVYNFVKKQIVRTLELSEWPECLCLSNRLSLVAMGTRSRLLQLKDYAQSSFQDYSHHSDTVSAVCFSNDDRKLISTAYNEIFIWDVNV